MAWHHTISRQPAHTPLHSNLHLNTHQWGWHRCHDKGATVQGAVSAASAVANAAVQAKEFPLPQNLLLQCPCSVREQVCLSFVFK